MTNIEILLSDEYKINDRLVIKQPTLREVIKFGENRYFSLVGRLTAYPSDMMSELFDIGIDYENISDFDMFIFMCKTIPVSESSILFGDLDLSSMELVPSDIGEPMLLDSKSGIRIDRSIHNRIFKYLVEVHGIEKDHKRAGNAHTKRVLIELDREEKALAQKKEYTSSLGNLISSMVNIDGFKYNYQTVQDITLYQLMDAVHRVQIIKSSLALLQGSYSGMIDTSKINKEHFNWLRDIKLN